MWKKFNVINGQKLSIYSSHLVTLLDTYLVNYRIVYFEGLFSIWHNFESTLANFVCFWAIFILVNGHIMKIKLPSGHTERDGIGD